MDIWIIILILLALSVVFLLASLFTKDEENELELKLDNYTTNQSEELFLIKNRLAELEKDSQADFFEEEIIQIETDSEPSQAVVRPIPELTVESLEEEIIIMPVNDEMKEEVISYYTQGYTMKEISNKVQINIETVQMVIDDYIENR